MTGFGQIYNGQLLKGLLFGIPNTTINFYGHLNEALLYAFLGDIEKSQTILNYQWILFYPAIFDISHWDAYEVSYEIQRKCAPPVSHKLPFILSGMFATVGVIFWFQILSRTYIFRAWRLPGWRLNRSHSY
ncbi:MULTISPECIES: hypothetical protein [Bacillaceae]|uniref:hypothetical protein n=1 Tax=Bacillaceae TaxID=186817 RepID=UPI0005565093|nr:hypothetical protein [Caldibacillus thermoamylovorans]